MIEKIIENWLIKASERSYQIPFCFFLMREGKTILHMTRHSLMEHGKDIVAVDKAGQLYAYQLKGIEGGRLTINGWKEIFPQLVQLVFTPITHPSITNKTHHRSYLVINGEIEEEVQHAITAFNADWEAKGHPHYRIETIVKGQIIDMAIRAKDSFLPTDIPDFKSLLEFQLENGTGFLNKQKLASMLFNLLKGDVETSDKKRRRAIANGALLTSLTANSFTQVKNHVAIVEAWTLYIFSALYVIEKGKGDLNFFLKELSWAQEIIKQRLQDLYEEAIEKNEFLQEDVLLDAFVFRHRTTIVLGLIAFLGTIDDSIDVDKMERFIDRHRENMVLWGESAVPFYLSLYFFYQKRNRVKAATFLEHLVEQILYAIKTPDTFFPDIYMDAETTIEINLPESFDNEGIELPNPRVGFVLKSLVSLAANDELRNVMERNWYEISKCIFSSVELDEPCDFYKYRVNGGKYINIHPNLTQSWRELVEAAKTYDETLVPLGVQHFKNWLPLFLMVYPHRLNDNLIKWHVGSQTT